MQNKLPKFFDNHKICIICEGNEEYEYLNRLKNLKVWNEQYDISLVNAGGNGNIPARYQDRYQNGADELVLVFCDTEKKPHEQYPSTSMQYNKYKTILEQVSHPQEATVNAINEPTKSTTTLDYYNQNAKKFITGTISVDFGTIQNRFLDKLHPGAEILDYGCGSGRDTKYFLEQGCKVTAIDGSQELCKLASEYTGIPVKHMLFQDLDEKEAYDGIWACSSILHVPANELRDIIKKMENALRAHGIIYTSFKYGTFEGERNSRYFTDMTEETFAKLIQDMDELEIEEQWITSDVRPGRGEEKWLNLILRKE